MSHIRTHIAICYIAAEKMMMNFREAIYISTLNCKQIFFLNPLTKKELILTLLWDYYSSVLKLQICLINR